MKFWKRNREIAEEIATHLRMAEQDGVPRREFGNELLIRETTRDAWGWTGLEALVRDLRLALRQMRRAPSFAAVAILTLALGSGATSLMFTVVHSVLLKPLPFRDPDRLIQVSARQESSHYNVQFLAYADFLDCRREVRSLDLAGWVYNNATLSEPGEAEYEDQFEITNDLFSLLGVRLFRGREFLPDEDRPGGTRVAILGYSLWQRHFGANPEAVGSSLVLDGKRYTIVGIAPPGLELAGEGDVYTPLGQDTAPYLRGRQPGPVRALGRLRPGASLAQTQAEFALIGRDLADQYPDTNKDRVLHAELLRPQVGDVQSTLWLLLGAVSLVLLIACVNVASLMLVRAVSREREMAMRVALGAARFRLIRQWLTESAVLSLAGGALGVALAALGLQPFLRFWPGYLPRAHEVHLDWRVLGFAVAVSLAAGFLSGLAPAPRIPARGIEQAIRSNARNIADTRLRLHAGFVISQVALAMVLLTSAGLLGRTLLRLSRLNPGVDAKNVLTSRIALSPSVLPYPAKIRATWADVLDHARHIPGVEAVAAVDTVPLREGHNENGYWPSAAVPPENRQPIAISTCVTPEYFKVMRIPLLAGRFFTENDRLGSRPVIVIDEVLAQNAFHGQNPVGRQLWIPDMGDGPQLIVGVVGHVRYWGLAGDDQAKIRAQFYYPFAQIPDAWTRRWSSLMSIAVRTTVPPLTVLQPLRHELRGSANDQVLYEVRTLQQLSASSVGRQRFLLLLFGAFAAFSLLLTCIGIYGTLAYLTGRRVPEIGVRMALGANTGEVLWMVLRQSVAMISTGAGVGVLASIAAGRLLQRYVEGVRPAEAPTLTLMISILVIAALAASFIPARRASQVDPMEALRHD
jgi:predicted permease